MTETFKRLFASAGTRWRDAGERRGEHASDDDEYVPFLRGTESATDSRGISHKAKRNIEYLSYDGRQMVPEMGVATTIKHSKLFIGCNVLVTALTLVLVAVALYADARHRTSKWYRCAEYIVLFLLSLDLWVEISFQGCRRFHCMEAGGGETSASVKGIPDNAAKCFSFYRCLGCCLSWIQVGINAQHASTRKARCGRIRMNAISIRCVVGLVVALRMFHDTFLRRQLPCRHWHSERRGRGCRHYARTDADTLLLVRTCNCVSLIVRVCTQANKQFQLWCGM